MCTWVGFRPIYWKCWSNIVVSTILRWFDLAMTLRWPYHDLVITPLWNPTPTHVTMCTWLGFRPIYFYTTLRVKGTLLRWHLVSLFEHSKSADHLKVTWYIIGFKKIWSTKVPRGGGGRGLQVSPRSNMHTWRINERLCAISLFKILAGWHQKKSLSVIHFLNNIYFTTWTCLAGNKRWWRLLFSVDLIIIVSRKSSVNPVGLTAKLFNKNFHSLEVVSWWSDPQLQAMNIIHILSKMEVNDFQDWCHVLSWTCSRAVMYWDNEKYLKKRISSGPAVKGLICMAKTQIREMSDR